MARRVTRPPPAGMPKFKLEIPTETPVPIAAEKVDVDAFGAQHQHHHPCPNPPPHCQGTDEVGAGCASQEAVAVGSSVAAAAPDTSFTTGVSAAPSTANSEGFRLRRGNTPPPPLIGPHVPLTAAALAAHTEARLRQDPNLFAPPSAFVGISGPGGDFSGSVTSNGTFFNATRASTTSTKRAIIQFDETLVSPVVAMGFHDPSASYSFLSGKSPTTSNSPPLLTTSSPTTANAAPAAAAKKFYQLQKSNLYVFEEGAPLVRDDGTLASQHQQWNELVGGACTSTEANKGIVGIGGGCGGGGAATPQYVSSDDITAALPMGEEDKASSSATTMMLCGETTCGGSSSFGGGGGGGFMGAPSYSANTAAGGGWTQSNSSNHRDDNDEDGDSHTTTTPTSSGNTRQQLHQQQLLLSPKRAPLSSGPSLVTGLNLSPASNAHGGGGLTTSNKRRLEREAREREKERLAAEAQAKQAANATKDKTIYLNQLELLEMVGAGQQGSVFKCLHKETQTVFALKKLSMAALQDNPDPIERQARKASIVRELKMLTECKNDCRNLVSLHNAYFQNNELMVLMEWMGSNVEDFLKIVARVPQETVQQIARECFQKGFGGDKTILSKIKSCGNESSRMMERARINRATALPEIAAAVITSDVLKGLAFLHSRLRIVHTDLKPANILLTTDNTMGKIADFGCSMRLGEDGKVRYKGVTLGTKLYMPPDRVNSLMMAGPEDDNSLLMSVPFSGGVASGGTAAFPSSSTVNKATITAFEENMDTSGAFDEKADIWSFGIVLLELVNGCHPCQALARDNYWNYANDLRFPKMIKPPQMSDLLYDVLQRCLAVEPAKRPSAQEILRMPFYQKYKDVDRKKFAQFVDRLKKSAASFEIENKRRELQKQLKASMTATTSQSYQSTQSKHLWAKHNNYLDRSGLDSNNFPSLPGM